jgi:hypothetical protein
MFPAEPQRNMRSDLFKLRWVRLTAMRKAAFFLLLLMVATFARAQDEFHRFAFNVGGGVGIPVGDTSDVAKVNGNFVVGGGMNFSQAFAFTGEFMLHGLPPTDDVLRAVLAPDASAHLYSVTGNFIGRMGANRRVGAYVIGGGGWYHRTWDITAPALVPGTVCGPNFFWYGITCVNGLVETDIVLRSGSADGGGLNIGGGVTFGGEGPGAKFYTEVRYHRAYFDNFDVEVLPVTFGLRW